MNIQSEVTTNRRRLAVVAFFAALALSLALQVENRAYASDFAGHPDEAAHVVTGLMVRDYLAGGFTETLHPLRYAEGYVESYPKVALGHYPPVFYAVEGAWMLLADSAEMALVLQAILVAACATAIFGMGCRFLPTLGAVASAALFCLLPLTQRYSAIVMSDGLLALLCLLAAAAFAAFYRTPSAKRALLFGVLAAAAILTKASGLQLALVPPLLILIGSRFDLVRNRLLWLAPVPVVLLALPWMVATFHITNEGAQQVGLLAYIKAAIPFYAGGLERVFGLPLLAASLAGAVFAVRDLRGSGERSTLPAACLALAVSCLVFCIVAPSGVDDRYLLVAAPPLLLLAILGVLRLGGLLGERSAPALYVVAAVAFAFSASWFQSPDKRATGYSAALDLVTGSGAKVLASSDARGEGALIADAALRAKRRPQGELIVARGSKVIADVKWMGQDHQLKFASAEELRDALRARFDYLVVDTGLLPSRVRPDHRLVEETAAKFPEEISLIGTVPSQRPNDRRGELRVYRILPTDHRG